MSAEIDLTGGQIRAARAFLRWSAETLATRSRVGISTVKRAESVDGAPPITRANLRAIQSTLEAGGVSFGDGDRASVRMASAGVRVGPDPG